MNPRDITGPADRPRKSDRDPLAPADPATDPLAEPRTDATTAGVPATTEPETRVERDGKRGRGRVKDKDTAPARRGGPASSTWVALIVGALLLILLLVFIMQNQQTVELHLFGWTWNFPLGVGLLLASIIGGLIMACAGIWKMVEMRRRD